jgi:hypothetical protein
MLPQAGACRWPRRLSPAPSEPVAAVIGVAAAVRGARGPSSVPVFLLSRVTGFMCGAASGWLRSTRRRMRAHPPERLRLAVNLWRRRGLKSHRNQSRCGGRRRRMRRDGALPDFGTNRRCVGAPGRCPAVAHGRRGFRGKSGGLKLQRMRRSCRSTHRRLKRSDDRAGDEIGYRSDGKRPQRSAPCGEKEQRQSDPSRGEADRDC